MNDLLKRKIRERICRSSMVIGAKKNDDGTYNFQASTENVDCYRTIIRQEGIDYKTRFEKNPVILRDHRTSCPVGQSVNTGLNEKGLFISVLFSKATKEATETEGLVADGTLRGASVGGRILSVFWAWDTEKTKPDLYAKLTDAEKEAMIKGDVDGIIFKMLLLEVSVCALPGNDECLADRDYQLFLESLTQDEASELFQRAFGPMADDRKEEHMSKPTETKNVGANAAPANPEVTTEQPTSVQTEVNRSESNRVAELENEIRIMREEAIAQRKREDEQDHQLLLRDGFSTPAHKDREVKFLGTLTRAQKDQYLELARSKPKCWTAERTARPAFDHPDEEAPEQEAWRSYLVPNAKEGK